MEEYAGYKADIGRRRGGEEGGSGRCKRAGRIGENM